MVCLWSYSSLAWWIFLTAIVLIIRRTVVPVSRDPRLRLMGQCGRFICVCYDVTCVCGGGIFLLLAQNLISTHRKMHTGILYPSHKTCLVMQSLPMRADQTVRHPLLLFSHWRSSFEFEWAVRLCWGGSNKGCSKYAIRWLSADWIVSPWLSYHKLMLWSSL